MRITGTFLDEISHDIPYQNGGAKEWDADLNRRTVSILTDYILNPFAIEIDLQGTVIE